MKEVTFWMLGGLLFILLAKPILILQQHRSIGKAVSLLANYNDDFSSKQKKNIAYGLSVSRDLWLSRGNNVCQSLGARCDGIGRSVLGISDRPITENDRKIAADLHYWNWAFSGGVSEAIKSMIRARV
ncbi:hypothetical protein NST41_33455 [Paenibacillus sp. FSL L8-0696]|uniref:hypothetical protein n=1 Tax=Paenibacillus sp. FSL L8-0696 TaxID=2954524 RepID=UPI003119EBEC